MKPILFNTDMVCAILDGRKTVTRRVVKPQPQGRLVPELSGGCWPGYFAEEGTPRVVRPPYHPGDILYVRETWAKVGDKAYGYKADNVWYVPRWRPSIHMPREAARIFLRVTDVRVERLQEITVDGALRDGTTDVEPPPICQKEPTYPESFPKGFDSWSAEKREDWLRIEARARYIGWCDYADNLLGRFRAIWDSTIKPKDIVRYGWDANPWVWVIEFERCERPEIVGNA